MSIADRQIAIATEIIEKYTGDLPFHLYLNNYFKQHKNFGSRDRKNYRNYCYAYWRLADAKNNLPVKEVIEHIVNADISSYEIDLSKIKSHLSKNIDYDYCVKLFAQQADTNAVVINTNKVNQNCIEKTLSPEIDDSNFTFTANTNLDWLINDGLGWIMDKGSVEVCAQITNLKDKTVWDSCSGAGGKSLWLSAFNRPKSILCTDLRSTILENLRTRFHVLSFPIPETKRHDVSVSPLSQYNTFDVVVCDVPCSGSGTWRRTPESYSFFDEKTISDFTKKQQLILSNASKNLAENGILYYITCSLFAAENEEIIQKFLEQNPNWKLNKSGYTASEKADRDVLYFAELSR